MSDDIQKIKLDEQNIRAFFEDALKNGVEIKDCNHFLSLLLERCCVEKRVDVLFPTIEAVAQKIQDKSFEKMQNHIIESIH